MQRRCPLKPQSKEQSQSASGKISAGIKQGKLESIEKIAKAYHITPEQVMETLEIPKEEWKEYLFNLELEITEE